MQFKESLKKPGTRIIAEFKRASPSLGDIDIAADPAERARMYEEGGAAAMSVLCEGPRFKGSPDDLRRAKGAAGIPLLAKDFISTTRSLPSFSRRRARSGWTRSSRRTRRRRSRGL